MESWVGIGNAKIGVETFVDKVLKVMNGQVKCRVDRGAKRTCWFRSGELFSSVVYP